MLNVETCLLIIGLRCFKEDPCNMQDSASLLSFLAFLIKARLLAAFQYKRDVVLDCKSDKTIYAKPA
jgi:hypothetical protein